MSDADTTAPDAAPNAALDADHAAGSGRVDLGRVRAEIRIVDELERIREMRRRRRGDDTQYADEIRAAAGPLDDELAEQLEPVLRLLIAARAGLARHPTAAASLFRALVAEGERVAATPEGRRRAVALAAAPAMNDLRRVWEATTLNMLGDATADASALPAGWIDLVLDAVIAGDADSLVGRLSEGRP